MDTVQIWYVNSPENHRKNFFLKIKDIESALTYRYINSPKVIYKQFFSKCCLKVSLFNGLPIVRLGTVRTIFLYMHSKETHISSINLFKRKHCLCPVLESIRHFTIVTKPGTLNIKFETYCKWKSSLLIIYRMKNASPQLSFWFILWYLVNIFTLLREITLTRICNLWLGGNFRWIWFLKVCKFCV